MRRSLTNPFISIIIRSYNRLDCVIDLIDRCLQQNYQNFEIVVVDQSDNSHWIKYEDKICSINKKFESLEQNLRVLLLQGT